MSEIVSESAKADSLVEKYRSALRRAGLRATYHRLAIAQYLDQTPNGVTIEELVRAIDGGRLERSTVTRILHAFSDAGLVIEHSEVRFIARIPLLERDCVIHKAKGA